MPTPAGDETTERTVDTLFEVLSHRYRRLILRSLRQQGEATVDDLTETVIASEGGPDTSDPSYDQVRAALSETHLPELESAGFLTYDRANDVVSMAAQTEAPLSWLGGASQLDRRQTGADRSVPVPTAAVRVLYVGTSTDGTDVAAALAEEDDEFVVETAETAAAALDSLTTARVDCLVSESDLPDSDGLSFLESVRERAGDVPVILCTDDAEEGFASDALEAGVTDVLRTAPDEAPALLANRVRGAVPDEFTGYRQVLDRLSAGVLVYECESGRIRDVNRRLCDLLGCTRSELLDADIETVGLPDSLTERAAAGEPLPELVDWRVDLPDGPMRHLEASGSRVVLGTTEYLTVTVQDVTTHAETEAALRESNRMFSTLVSNLPGIAYRCRNERGWPMTFVSDGCRELTGYDPDDIQSGDVSWGEDVVHPADRSEVWEAVQSAIEAREPFEITYRILRADDTERWVWEQGRGVYDDHELEALEGFITDITERKERERRLDAIFNQTYQFTGLMEPDGTLIEANETALEFGDLDREDVIGEKVWDTYWWQVDEATTERLREAVERAADGEFVRYQTEVQGAEGLRTIDFSIRPVTDEDGDVELLIPEGRDITELERREDQLESLNALSQELTTVDTMDEIARVAVDAAETTLGLELAAVELYDEESGTLQPCARSEVVTDLVGDEPLLEPGQEKAWQAYLDNEDVVYEDLRARTGAPSTGTPLDSAIVLPLGRHGVFIAGAATPDAFAEAEVNLARILAAHVEAELARVERERSLRERTETLERKTERLERMNRVNEVIRDLTQTLIDASNREEIEQEVCESLASADPYTFAWIGTEDPVSGELRPVASAGDGADYLDVVTATTGEDAPEGEVAGWAYRTGEPQVVDTIRTDPPFDPWRQEALERGFQTAISVPVAYEGVTYGVLTLYGEEAETFDDVEQEVITELGETVGYAITAAERKAGLASDQVTELQFNVREVDDDLFRCMRAAGGEFELEGIVRQGTDSNRLFFTLEEGSLETLSECTTAATGVRDFRHVAGDEEESLVAFVTVGEGVVGTILEHGALPRQITSADDHAELVVELPGTRNVREFASMFEEQFEDSTLVARRERDRPIQTTEHLREDVTELLTDSQLEALKTAYFSGFFESPRQSSGQEVADALDISQPTFIRHLRGGQRALFERLFDE